MRKSGPGETISRLLRRRSSPSLYAVAPVSGREPDKLDEIMVLQSKEGALNAIVDSGTAKVKQRPTVKLGIPFLERPGLAVPIPNVQEQTLFSKIPRTMTAAGTNGRARIDQPKVGSYGDGITNAGDDWIPPPPSMAPPPPPPPPIQSPHVGQLPYNESVPPPPSMAPPPPPSMAPPPPPPLNLHQNPTLQAANPLAETNYLPAPVMLPPPPPPPMMAPQKPPSMGQYPKTPPPFLPPNDYAIKPVHSHPSKPNHIKHPKKTAPPPPQRDVTRPPKPERNLTSAPKFNATSSQISTSNNSSFLAEHPDVSKVVSTFNPKATAKLYGFPNPANVSETSSEPDQKIKTKSLFIMQDAKPYQLEPTVGVNLNDSVHQKTVREGTTENPSVNKAQTDSIAARPQKPARKSQVLMQQPKSAPNMHLARSNPPIDYPAPHLSQNNWINKSDDQASSTQIQDSNNNQTFPNLPVPSAELGIVNGKSGGAEEETKPSGKGDFPSRSSSGNGLSEFPYVEPIAGMDKTADAPDSLPEQTQPGTEQSLEARSPLALLMAAKQRDVKNRTAHKSASNIPTLSMGGTRYIKSKNPNTFQIVPRASYGEPLSPEGHDIPAQIKDGDDVVPVRGAGRNLDRSEFSLYPTPHGPAEPEDSQKDQDVTLLLLPPPPLFSDEDNEELSLSFLPPPAEFCNLDDNGNDSLQPEREVSRESGAVARSDRAHLSQQSHTYGSGNHLTSTHHDNPTSRNSSFINRPSINTSLLSSVSNSTGHKPLIAPKPNSMALNEGSAKLQNSNYLLSKARERNVPKVEQKQAETGLPTSSLSVKSGVIGELQLSTQSDMGSKSSHSSKLSQSHGKTFTIRPGTKHPMTLLDPSTTK